MQSCTYHRYWIRQILYYSYSFRATGGGRKGENLTNTQKEHKQKVPECLLLWRGPMVTLSVLGATVNYLLTPWTWQLSMLQFGFSVCVSEVFAKQSRELLEWRHIPLQFCSWHSKNKLLFLSPPSRYCLWSPHKMYPFGCWWEKLFALKAESSPSSKSDLMDSIETWITWWGRAKWCLCLPESLLLAESRQYFALVGTDIPFSLLTF